MEQLLKYEGVPASIVATILVLVGAYAWAGDDYVKRTEFAGLQKTVVDGFEEIRINDASQIIRDIKLELRIAKSTGATENEIGRLDDELQHMIAYKTCLVRQEPNCEHLKDVE